MATFRAVFTSFWTDNKIVDDFTAEERFVYMYLLTAPHGNMCGCFQIPFKVIANETGLDVDVVKTAVTSLDEQRKVIGYDAETKEVIILNWGKYQWTASERVLAKVKKEAEFIKNETFKAAIIAAAEAVLASKDRTKAVIDHDTLSIPYRYPIDTLSIPSCLSYSTDTVYNDSKNKEKVLPKGSTKKKTGAPRFSPPSPSDVKAYCDEQGYDDVDAEHFCDFYSSKGWKVGNQSMKDWKAAVRNWRKRNSSNSKPTARSGTTDERNKFNRFEQRENDFGAIEERMFNRKAGG